jgi:O-antigen biosynthesis protein
MTQSGGDLHVYLRSMARGERSSLSVLAGFVTPGSRVLDLGTGSGALGQHLRKQSDCTVDGVTYNEKEAQLARAHYRRVEVADLEQPGWTSLFAGERYDFIVCGDVLEHLRRPEVALKACRDLLGPQGRVLISVPNAAYSGLVAELLQGDFKYREEGLLDRTHLRFFTRRSLQQFLAAEGWSVEKLETVDRPLNESEFQVAFDSLPPAVARYLLVQPDAAAYQLVLAARPGAGADGDAPAGPGPAAALFSAQLYLDTGTGFNEAQKLVTPGVVGALRQVLRFTLPAGSTPLTRLRLDPADRPGFLHLYRISLLAGPQVAWQWRCDTDGLAALEGAPHQDMMLRAPWPAAAALVLLHGNDPHVELPVPAQALAAAGTGGVLEVELGWPMSADYLALAEQVQPLRRQVDESQARTRQALSEAGQARQEAVELQSRLEMLAQTQAQLAEKLESQERQHKSMSEEKNSLSRQKAALQGELLALGQQYQALAQHLRWIENSTVFRMTRPLVHAKMGLERLLGRRSAEQPAPVPRAQPIDPIAGTVDIIVPVYRGLEDTRRCIEAVLSSECKTPWRLVIINDASPEPEVTEWLRQASTRDSRILLLENEHNLGFVGTVNRGMALPDRHDALLLNSDTEVANDWLDRLHRAAYSDARVASVTPFSNNATICSYPRFCEDNELPPGVDTAQLDRLFARTNPGQAVDVPTGVGFCMYIRRDCLDEVGLFDVEEFGKGYGEENDFCQRAIGLGWRNLHALDTFVLHTGGVSFGASKSQREIDAVEKLRRLHPSYDRQIHDFVKADPARAARLAVDIARVQACGLPRVLAVVHSRGGGTLRHVSELAWTLRSRAVFFCLLPAPGGAVWLDLVEPGAGFRLEFSVTQAWPELLDTLRALGIGHVHFHHLLGHNDLALALGRQLGVSWDFTAHDFYAMCPQISLTDANDRYCGEQGEGRCHQCLGSQSPDAASEIARWRERYGMLLTQARHVLAPSLDAARRFARMWPEADVRMAPHTDIPAVQALPVPAVPAKADGEPLRVAVLGGLSRIKGADVLEAVAMLAAKQKRPMEFHLVGHAYRNLKTQPRAALTVHGSYEEEDLPGLLDWLKPDLVWFPALWPETYSYTLSACLQAGLPVVAPDLGAFAQRLDGRKWSWIKPWDTSPADWVDFFDGIRGQHFAAMRSPPPPLFLRQPLDERIGAWSYQGEYLQGLPVLPQAALPRDSLVKHRPGQTGAAGSATGLRQLALDALVRLRSAPLLRGAARAIPQRWQRRVKTWLQA